LLIESDLAALICTFLTRETRKQGCPNRNTKPLRKAARVRTFWSYCLCDNKPFVTTHTSCQLQYSEYINYVLRYLFSCIKETHDVLTCGNELRELKVNQDEKLTPHNVTCDKTSGPSASTVCFASVYQELEQHKHINLGCRANLNSLKCHEEISPDTKE